MKVAILGATGRSGRHAVDEALARGWSVRALARDPAKVATRHEKLEVVAGDAGDREVVDRLVAGCDAVVSALGGAQREPWVCSRGTENVLAAMAKHGVRRYVLMSGASSRLPGERQTAIGRVASWLTRAMVRPVVEDKEREFALLTASDVDWTALRAAFVRDGPKRGLRYDLRAPPSMGTTFADAGEALIREVEERRFVRQAPYFAA